MTDHVTTPMASPETGSQSNPMGQPSVLRVLRDQRKAILVGAVMMIASFWIAGQLGEWRLAASIAGGVGLGLANHLATEYWLLKIICSGEQPTRGELTAATLVRLALLSVIAVGVAIWLWPDGIGLLLGLAVFRLIALVMTGIPLLKELKKQ